MPFLYKLTKRLVSSRALAIVAIVAIGIAACTAGDRAATDPGIEDSLQAKNSSTTVTSVTLSPSSATGSLGQSAQFTATAHNASGGTLSAGVPAWSSTDSSIVSVSPSGMGVAVGVGQATVTATISGVRGVAQTTVTGDPIASIAISPSTASATVGQQAQFTAALTGASGATLTGRRVIWTSSNPAVVKVDTTGFATGVATGSATIVATSAGKTASAAVTVGTGTPVSNVATVTVSPGTASGSVGQSAQFSAVVKDANGNALTGQTIAWSSTNTAVVTVNSSGYATGVGAGSAAVVANTGGKSGQAQITVTGGTLLQTVGTVVLSPATASLAVGATQPLATTITSTLGSILTGTPVSWSSSNPAVATVSSSGVVTGITAGSVTITATSGAASGTSSISITGPPSSGGTGEPMPGTGTMLWQDALNAATDATILSPYALMTGSNSMHADPAAGPNGAGALRIDWMRSTTCQDDWSGIEHGIPGAPTEIYVQFWVRYQSGFAPDWLYSGQTPCTGTAKKLFLVWSGDNVSRFIYQNENHDLHAGSDYENSLNLPTRSQNTGSTMSVDQYTDGSWHRITFHFKQSSSTTATDGFMYGWIDGVLRWSKPNWASGSVGGWVDFKFPSTFNQGSPANQSEWLSGLAIWRP